MSNQLFIDTMDKVNAFAKQVGFTNGIAWARAQKENNRLNSYDYEIFSGCHDLRNLMAHGFAKDINISSETLQKAQLFFKAISAPYTVNGGQSIVFNNVKSDNNELEIQPKDYVLVFGYGYSRGSKIEIGGLYQVSRRDSGDTDWLLYDIVEKRLVRSSDISWMYESPRFYVVRADLSKYTQFGEGFVRPFNPIVSTSNGRSTVTFTLKHKLNDESRLITAKGYFAHKECFKNKSGILLMGPGESMEAYIEKVEKKLEKMWLEEKRSEEENGDLPF